MTVSLPARRVITLAPVLPAYATIDGGADHIVATSGETGQEQLDEPLAKIYPALSHLPLAGPITLQDPERILVFRPDVVFTWSESQPLRDIEFPGLAEITVSDRSSAPAFEDRLKLWRFIGAIAGRQARTENLIQQCLRDLEDVKRSLPAPVGPKPKVLVLRIVADLWIFVGAGTDFYLDHALASAGAENVVPSGQFIAAGTIDVEQLIKLDPDLILLDTIPEDKFPEVLYRQPGLRIIRAVKDRGVYTIPHFALSMDPVEDPLLLRWLAEVLYPQRVGCSLRSAVRETYFNGFGYDISEDEIDDVLMLRPNRGSTGYQRFAGSCSAAKPDRPNS